MMAMVLPEVVLLWYYDVHANGDQLGDDGKIFLYSRVYNSTWYGYNFVWVLHLYKNGK